MLINKLMAQQFGTRGIFFKSGERREIGTYKDGRQEVR